MYCDLISFGKYISARRKSFSYTQRCLSNLSSVSIDSLRRIENGKVHPTYETLNFLSRPLKEDLNKTLLNYQIFNNDEYFEVKHRIEKKISNGLYNELEKDLSLLQEILVNSKLDNYLSISIKQLILFLESVILNTIDINYESSLAVLTEAIQLTTSKFTVDNYMNFTYSDFEIRILMNIALLKNKFSDIDKSIEMLTFCLCCKEIDDINLKISIIYNLSYNFHRIDLHEKALYYANKGISLCVENNNMYGLGLLYSRKGIAEFFLENDNFINSLKQAVNIYDMANQNNLKNMLIDFFRKHDISIL